MTTTTVDLQTRVQRLASHLLRARRAEKPAILLVVYRSEFARAEAERELVEQLREAGEEIVRLRVKRDGPTVDLPTYLHEHSGSGKAIFFVYDIGQGGEATEQYLNYRRELLVQDGQRLVIWLPEQALARLARNAPDFWAFRGRTVEFLETPTPEHQEKLASDLSYYEWKGDYSQTREELEAGIRLREDLLRELPGGRAFDANRVSLLESLAGQYAQAERYEEAINTYRRVIELFPQAKSSWQGLGVVFHRRQRYEEAVAALQRAIELDPEFTLAWYSLGNVYHDMRRYEEAIHAYQRAIDLDEHEPKAWNSLGNVYRELQRYEEAIQAYRQAIDSNSEVAYPWYNLGVALNNLQQYEKANEAFRHAIELEPGDSDSWTGLGIVLSNLGRLEEAINAFRQATELEPENSLAWNHLGLAYSIVGDEEQALEAQSKAVELAPDNATYHGSLAGVLKRLGRKEEAEMEIAKARRMVSNATIYNRASIEAVAGNTEVALDLLKEALQQEPFLREWVLRDPDFLSLHDDHRFRELTTVSELGTDERP